MTDSSSSQHPTYSERLWPNSRGVGLAFLFIVSAAIAVGAVNFTAGVVSAIGITVAVAIALYVYAAPISVEADILTAGRAQIPVEFTGAISVLTPAEVKAQLGPGSDARTYAVLRSKIPTAVLVQITDPDDPTPQWLVSTRHPRRLSQALLAAQSAHSVQTGSPSRSSAN